MSAGYSSAYGLTYAGFGWEFVNYCNSAVFFSFNVASWADWNMKYIFCVRIVMLKSGGMNSLSSPSTWSCCSGALCLMDFPCTSHSQSSSPPCLPPVCLSYVHSPNCYWISECPHVWAPDQILIDSTHFFLVRNCAIRMAVVSYYMYMYT